MQQGETRRTLVNFNGNVYFLTYVATWLYNKISNTEDSTDFEYSV